MHDYDESTFLNKQIPIFFHTAPYSENMQLHEEIFEETTKEGTIKLVAQNTLIPTLTPFIPKEECKAAIMIIPGGAFKRQVLNTEGFMVAKWLNEYGIAAFVLKHRLPINNFPNNEDITLIDGQRALRYIRYNSKQFGIDEDKIGVMGFSAGGHLASLISTCYDKKVYNPIDEIDEVSARPSFCVLGYPAICYEMEEIAAKNKGETVPDYRTGILKKYSTDTLVHKNVPPTFIFETDDDRTTPAEHSVRYYLALRNNKVSGELHIFKKGSHGFGLGKDEELTGAWKDMLIKWIKFTI